MTATHLGLSRKAVPIPMVLFARKELTLVRSRNSACVFALPVDLVRRNHDRATRFISYLFPFDRAPDAFDFAYRSPATTEKVTVTFSARATARRVIQQPSSEATSQARQSR